MRGRAPGTGAGSQIKPIACARGFWNLAEFGADNKNNKEIARIERKER